MAMKKTIRKIPPNINRKESFLTQFRNPILRVGIELSLQCWPRGQEVLSLNTNTSKPSGVCSVQACDRSTGGRRQKDEEFKSSLATASMGRGGGKEKDRGGEREDTAM